MDENELSNKIIGAAIEVHRTLGHGLLESTYVECLCYELALNEIPFERQALLPVVYKGWDQQICKRFMINGGKMTNHEMNVITERIVFNSPQSSQRIATIFAPWYENTVINNELVRTDTNSCHRSSFELVLVRCKPPLSCQFSLLSMNAFHSRLAFFAVRYLCSPKRSQDTTSRRN